MLMSVFLSFYMYGRLDIIVKHLDFPVYMFFLF